MIMFKAVCPNSFFISLNMNLQRSALCERINHTMQKLDIGGFTTIQQLRDQYILIHDEISRILPKIKEFIVYFSVIENQLKDGDWSDSHRTVADQRT